MFVSINVDLGGIPLGFGFTLEKVGGLVGVHRSINTTAFQEGVRTGLLDSVLFPDDPIVNAARILSDIESAHPQRYRNRVPNRARVIRLWGDAANRLGRPHAHHR